MGKVSNRTRCGCGTTEKFKNTGYSVAIYNNKIYFYIKNNLLYYDKNFEEFEMNL
jgi:hypothetical protein